MWKNNLYNDILSLLLERRLGKAIRMIEGLSSPSGGVGEASGETVSYRLLADYWQRGFADPQREQLYDQLLRRVYVLTANMAQRDRRQGNAWLASVYASVRQSGSDWSVADIRRRLEDYVSGTAMLQLEPEHVRQQKAGRLYEEHQRLMGDLFNYVWTSGCWKDTESEAFGELLLTPTVDADDQLLLVSAVTLSAMNTFDMGKFRLLADVYRQTSSELLRQRALVGWVFAAQPRLLPLYPELRTIIDDLCSDPRTLTELTELQMQMLFCMSAEDDRQTIQNEIIPELIKGNNLRVTRHGIVEQEEDTLENILHPDAAERNMERMEESMRRMMDMQKKGSDIYFAGFSQMKRFAFFDSMANWFMPFQPHHPGISRVWQQSRGHRFLQIIMKLGAFCDSDKYSFVLAYDQVLDRLPKQMLRMIEQGEAMPMPVGGEVAVEEQQKPAFIRRLYLQNLYRFFRLHPQRAAFASPFDEQASVFFASPLFRGTALEEHVTEVASFLSKHGRADAAMRVLDNVSPGRQDVAYCLLMASLLMRQTEQSQLTLHTAMEYYRKALELEPQNRRALMGFARACFACEDYERALEAYTQLLGMEPESKAVQLNTAVCLTSLRRYDEALKLLYKLNYLDGDDLNVMRVLAWTQTVSDKCAQAARLYERLLAAESPQPADMLNYGYCLWLSGDVAAAVGMMRRFLEEQKDPKFSIWQELMHTGHQLLQEHGVTDTEILLMLDALEE